MHVAGRGLYTSIAFYVLSFVSVLVEHKSGKNCFNSFLILRRLICNGGYKRIFMHRFPQLHSSIYSIPKKCVVFFNVKIFGFQSFTPKCNILDYFPHEMHFIFPEKLVQYSKMFLIQVHLFCPCICMNYRDMSSPIQLQLDVHVIHFYGHRFSFLSLAQNFF